MNGNSDAEMEDKALLGTQTDKWIIICSILQYISPFKYVEQQNHCLTEACRSCIKENLNALVTTVILLLQVYQRQQISHGTTNQQSQSYDFFLNNCVHNYGKF